jgi:two-component system, chemotaxis family, CheB/CheR fusion protein
VNPHQTGQDFENLLEHVKEARGFDFTAYKRASLQRRVRRRMSTVGCASYGEYLDYLQVHPEEFEPLFNTIVINVTAFFRDRDAWDFLAAEVVPVLVDLKTPEGLEKDIRVWSAGCASGEEAYTLAIVLAEALGVEAFQRRVKIYATDVDEEALMAARHGTYAMRETRSVPVEFRSRYFDRNGDLWSFNKDLRRSIIFGRNDLLQDAPISRIDLLVSRNTLMYLIADAQTRVLERFRYALNEGGFLFLGRAETVLARSEIFQAVSLRHRLFVKSGVNRVGGPIPVGGAQPAPALGIETQEALQRLQSLAFKSEPVAQVILDRGQRFMFANDTAVELLDLSPHDIGRPFSELDFSRRPADLRRPVDQVLNTRGAMRLDGIGFPASGDSRRWFDVLLTPLIDVRGDQLGVRIVFVDVSHLRQLTEELQQSQANLETANEELQSGNEELETTNEELQSTIEELETTNEELQSTNEELETINEELHSTSEELEIANKQLGQRSQDLDQSFAYFQSVLTSMKAAVVVLGPGFIVRTWSRRAEDIWGARPEEAQGVHFSDLDIGFPVDGLLQPVRDCMAGRIEEHVEVLPAMNRRGRPISCRVTLSPLKESGDRITGVVVLMEEMSADEGR